MKVSQIMNVVDFAEGDDSVQAVAELMGDLDVGAVPVGTAEAPEGIVTDRDILFRVAARGLDPKAVTAREVMSAPLITCLPDDSLEDALDLMAASQMRRLGVREPGGPIVGWVTLSDVSRVLLLESGTMARSLGEISGDSAG